MKNTDTQRPASLAAAHGSPFDICERPVGGGLLTKCVVCGKDYCSTCKAIMCGCIHQPDVCKKCAEHEAVKTTVEKFATPLMAILKQRNKALATLIRVQRIVSVRINNSTN